MPWPTVSTSRKIEKEKKFTIIQSAISRLFVVNFHSYEMVRVTENRFEPPENGRGLFSYLFDEVNSKCQISNQW